MAIDAIGSTIGELYLFDKEPDMYEVTCQTIPSAESQVFRALQRFYPNIQRGGCTMKKDTQEVPYYVTTYNSMHHIITCWFKISADKTDYLPDQTFIAETPNTIDYSINVKTVDQFEVLGSILNSANVNELIKLFNK